MHPAESKDLVYSLFYRRHAASFLEVLIYPFAPDFSSKKAGAKFFISSVPQNRSFLFLPPGRAGCPGLFLSIAPPPGETLLPVADNSETDRSWSKRVKEKP